MPGLFYLGLRLANMLTKSFNLFQYRIGGGRLDQGPGVAIGVLDEMVDLPDQIFHASECAPADGLLSDDIEPYLYLVQPGSVGRRKMNLKARMNGQPNPARGKGDQERRQGITGNNEANLYAVEPDVQEVEGDEKKNGCDRECAGEIDEVDSRM
jgi:hypothetical protein